MCLRGSQSVFHREKLEQSVKDDEFLSEFSSKIQINTVTLLL